MNKKVLAIDFDGVIHDFKNPLKGRRMGAPLPGAKEALIAYKQRGDTIIIHSVWGDKPKAISDFMDYYGLPFDTITNIKPNADVYLDDKAIRFINWTETFNLL